MFSFEELVFRASDQSVSTLSKGKFARQILVLTLAESDSNHISFINKVLAAVKLDLEVDALYAEVAPGQAINCFSGLKSPPKFVLVFGLSPKHVRCFANVRAYEPLSINRCTWLFADALSILEPNRDKKTQLWNALKSVFL